MLVRFLSFAASVIGTRRYRPIVLSLAVVVLSVASIMAVTSVFRGQAEPAASTSQPPSDAADQKATSGLEGLQKQTPHDEPTNTTPTQSQTPSPDGDSKPSGNGVGQATPAATDVQLSATTLNLSFSTPTLQVHANTSDKSSVAWAVTADTTDSGVTASIDQTTTGSSISLRFKLDPSAAPGTYQFTVNAKDVARGVDLSKKITVVVSN